jgi:hypothetical protein
MERGTGNHDASKETCEEGETMTTFEDGPAAGKALAIKLSPPLLRVVCNQKGEWDALDKPSDMPASGEKVWVYQLVKHEGHMHIRGQKFSGFFPVATYHLYPEQPDDATVRGVRAWHEWQKQRATT